MTMTTVTEMMTSTRQPTAIAMSSSMRNPRTKKRKGGAAAAVGIVKHVHFEDTDDNEEKGNINVYWKQGKDEKDNETPISFDETEDDGDNNEEDEWSSLGYESPQQCGDHTQTEGVC